MGIYTDGLTARQKAKRIAKKALVVPDNASQWEIAKRVLNIKLNNHPAKGLKDGRCNRTACQEPLAGRHQWTMIDHEQHDANERLYYCEPCARMFNGDDALRGVTLRCTQVS